VRGAKVMTIHFTLRLLSTAFALNAMNLEEAI
jgi:hypothetical protein